MASMVALALPARVHAAAAALGGSMASMQRQHDIALTSEYPFMHTRADVLEHVEDGALVQVPGGVDYALANVSFPFAVPEVLLFIERLAADYRVATNEQLVVTSLTRPLSLQPQNAHELSVHPAGMAVDLRVPARAKARTWLQQTLLELERAGVLDVTREYHPPHYHVAVYPSEYRAYVAAIDAARDSAAANLDTVAVVAAAEPEVPSSAADTAQLSVTKAGGADGVHTVFPFIVGSMCASAGAVSARRRARRTS